MAAENQSASNFAKDIWQKDNDHFTHPSLKVIDTSIRWAVCGVPT